MTFELARGKRWEVAGYGVDFSGVATGSIALYVNEVAGTNLIWTASSNGIDTKLAANFGDLGPEVTEDDVRLIVVVSAGAAIPVSGNIRVREYDKNPNVPKSAR